MKQLAEHHTAVSGCLWHKVRCYSSVFVHAPLHAHTASCLFSISFVSFLQILAQNSYHKGIHLKCTPRSCWLCSTPPQPVGTLEAVKHHPGEVRPRSDTQPSNTNWINLGQKLLNETTPIITFIGSHLLKCVYPTFIACLLCSSYQKYRNEVFGSGPILTAGGKPGLLCSLRVVQSVCRLQFLEAGPLK